MYMRCLDTACFDREGYHNIRDISTDLFGYKVWVSVSSFVSVL